MAAVEEEEGLREAKENNYVDNAKGEHVTGYHGEDHCDEGSGQANGTKGEEGKERQGKQVLNS